MANNRKPQPPKNPVPPPPFAANDDFARIGPVSIEGVEANDLPDKGRGDVFTDPGKEAARKLPQKTGQWGSGETGLRGDPDIADSQEHGHRKRS